MFEKEYECECKVVVEEHVVALFHEGKFFTNSSVDSYTDKERGYGCSSAEEVADQFHRNFCPLTYRQPSGLSIFGPEADFLGLRARAREVRGQ